MLGSIAISQQAFDASFDRPQNAYTFLNVKDGVNDIQTGALKLAMLAYPDAKVATRSEWVDTRAKGVNTLLNLLYVLLALSVVVSLFGMVNTLVLSVFERTRELGMLRAVGMTRRQVRRMIRAESVVTALIGAAMGLPLGIFLAWMVTKALSGQGVSFAIPGKLLVYFVGRRDLGGPDRRDRPGAPGFPAEGARVAAVRVALSSGTDPERGLSLERWRRG